MKNFKQRGFCWYAIIAGVLLTVLHILGEQYAYYDGWSVSARRALLWPGLLLDLLFSAEFILRSVKSAREKKLMRYLKHRKGWSDFCGSLPVLILYSVPAVYFSLAGDPAETGVFKDFLIMNSTVSIIMMLRLMRVIKLTVLINYTKSLMNRHHTSAASSAAVTTAVICVIIMELFTGILNSGISGIISGYQRNLKELESVAVINRLEFMEACESFLLSDNRVLKVTYRNGGVAERLSESEFRKYFRTGDYTEINGNLCSVVLSLKDTHRDYAIKRLLMIVIVVSLPLVFITFYSIHFARTVSDTAGVLNSGFRKKDYNLMAKIRDEYRYEELYRIARFYNDVYLPAKIRRGSTVKEERGTPLTLKDLDSYKREG